jgi:hypothetical protein
MTVNEQLVEIGLDRIDGNTFEDFSQSMMAAFFGHEFVPEGGNKDQGADGFFRTGLSQRKGVETMFFQSSIETDFKGKITKTLNDLQQNGRSVRTLIYATSRSVKLKDKLEQEISDSFDVTLRIYDRPWFLKNINHSKQTQAAFQNKMKIKQTMGKVLPGPLGLSMARRVEGQILQDVLEKLKEAQNYDPARRQSEITMIANDLKGRYLGHDKGLSQKSESAPSRNNNRRRKVY